MCVGIVVRGSHFHATAEPEQTKMCVGEFGSWRCFTLVHWKASETVGPASAVVLPAPAVFPVLSDCCPSMRLKE